MSYNVCDFEIISALQLRLLAFKKATHNVNVKATLVIDSSTETKTLLITFYFSLIVANDRCSLFSLLPHFVSHLLHI